LFPLSLSSPAPCSMHRTLCSLLHCATSLYLYAYIFGILSFFPAQTDDSFSCHATPTDQEKISFFLPLASQCTLVPSPYCPFPFFFTLWCFVGYLSVPPPFLSLPQLRDSLKVTTVYPLVPSIPHNKGQKACVELKDI
jgi:hypothetical protein